MIGLAGPMKLVERVHAASAEACEEIVESLLGGAHLNYVLQQSFVQEEREIMWK